VAVSLLAAATLGYGYWFAATHGSLSVSADDVSEPNRPQAIAPLEVTFFDDAHRELARAQTLPPWNPIVLTSPHSYACHDADATTGLTAEARDRWQTCFARQSRWLPTWVETATHVTLDMPGCRLERVPIVVERYADTWWLWWVPLPHIGGKPYTSFNVRVMVNVGACTVTTQTAPG